MWYCYWPCPGSGRCMLDSSLFKSFDPHLTHHLCGVCMCVCVCVLNYWLLHLRMYYMHIIRGIPEWHCWLTLPVMKAPASCIDSLLAVTPTHCMVTVQSEWRYKTGTPWWLHLHPLRSVRSTLVHMHTISFNPRNTQITLTERRSKRQSKRIFTRIATLSKSQEDCSTDMRMSVLTTDDIHHIDMNME